MRRLRYNVAASLDGYIADANGAFDWILHDDTVDFVGLFERVDTIVLGRRTYDTVRAQGAPPPWKSGTRVYVVSRTLPPAQTSGVTVVQDAAALASTLRHEAGDGEIWLFGGGQLFGSLLTAGQVDAVEVTIVPVLLGQGVPLMASFTGRVPLELTHSHVYPTGMVALHYAVSEPLVNNTEGS